MLQISGCDIEAGTAVLVLLHHRRLPCLSRSCERLYHRTHHWSETQRPRHPREGKIFISITGPIIVPRSPAHFTNFKFKPPLPPRIHCINTEGPRTLPLTDHRSETRETASDATSHRIAIRQSDHRCTLYQIRSTIDITCIVCFLLFRWRRLIHRLRLGFRLKRTVSHVSLNQQFFAIERKLEKQLLHVRTVRHHAIRR